MNDADRRAGTEPPDPIELLKATRWEERLAEARAQRKIALARRDAGKSRPAAPALAELGLHAAPLKVGMPPRAAAPAAGPVRESPPVPPFQTQRLVAVRAPVEPAAAAVAVPAVAAPRRARTVAAWIAVGFATGIGIGASLFAGLFLMGAASRIAIVAPAADPPRVAAAGVEQAPAETPVPVAPAAAEAVPPEAADAPVPQPVQSAGAIAPQPADDAAAVPPVRLAAAVAEAAFAPVILAPASARDAVPGPSTVPSGLPSVVAAVPVALRFPDAPNLAAAPGMRAAMPGPAPAPGTGLRPLAPEAAPDRLPGVILPNPIAPLALVPPLAEPAAPAAAVATPALSAAPARLAAFASPGAPAEVSNDSADLAGRSDLARQPAPPAAPSPGTAPAETTLRLSQPKPVSAIDHYVGLVALPRAVPDRVRIRTAPLSAAALRLHVNAPSTLDDAEVAQISARLAATGAVLADRKTVAFKVSEAQVRFFHEDDEEGATLVAQAIGATLRDFTAFRPTPPDGVVEVYLQGDAAAPAPRKKAVRARSGSELTRLRDRLVQKLRRGDYN